MIPGRGGKGSTVAAARVKGGWQGRWGGTKDEGRSKYYCSLDLSKEERVHRSELLVLIVY